MTIRTRILAVTVPVLLLAVIVTAGVAILGIQKQYAENTARYRSQEMSKIRDKLKNLVDVAYSAIERSHREAQDKESLKNIYGSGLQDMIGIAQSIAEEMAAKVELGTLTEAQAKEEASKAIRKIRDANGTGYVWINDMGEPMPKMVMHPFSPELEGEILDAPQYNCALGKNENLFKASVDVCKVNGEGFVDYRWGRPTAQGLSEPLSKLSYVRLYEPLGWVVGTGVYTDEIDTAISDQMEVMNSQVTALVGRVIHFSAIMCGCAIIASIVSARSISRPVTKLIGTMRAVRNEGLSNKRANPAGASEIRELGEIFNKMLDTINGGMQNLKKETAAIANGNFSQRVPARGDNDFMAEVINQLAEQRQKAAEEVKVYTIRLEQRAAIESSLSQLNTNLQGDLTVARYFRRCFLEWPTKIKN